MNQFLLYSWRHKQKTFSLVVYLPKNDYLGWSDYYTIDAYRTDKHKRIGTYRGRRFTSFVDSEWFAFKNILLDHDPEAWQKFLSFHQTKIDILSLPVLLVA